MTLELPPHLLRAPSIRILRRAWSGSTQIEAMTPAHYDILPRDFLQSQRLHRILIFNPCNINGSAKAECTSSLLEYFLGFVRHTNPIEPHIMPPADTPPSVEGPLRYSTLPCLAPQPLSRSTRYLLLTATSFLWNGPRMHSLLAISISAHEGDTQGTMVGLARTARCYARW